MKPLSMQAREAIGRQYARTHASQTVKATLGAVKGVCEFLRTTYGLQRIENIKPHMVEKFIAHRQAAGVSAVTLTRDATALRMIADGVGKADMIPKTNAALGINRDTAARYNPTTANTDKLAEIRSALVDRAERTGLAADKALVAAYDVRAEFGLRANESFMSRVREDEYGNLKLEVLGAKGGRPRELDARSESQIRALEQYRATSKEIGNHFGKLIPPHMSARQMYDHQRNTIANAGGTRTNGANMHSQRHKYAQERTAVGTAAAEVSQELGHNREEVVNHYVK